MAIMSIPSELLGASASHMLAPSSPADERTRVLKHADTFAVFDHYGDIRPGGLGEQGLYHDGTRFLSCLLLLLHGRRPFFLNSTVRDENDQLTVSLTNPDLIEDGRVRLTLGTVHLALRRFLWQGVSYQQLRVMNHASESVNIAVSLRFGADFADIFEVRGMRRNVRGLDLPVGIEKERLVFAYEGLDGIVRRTVLQFDPGPSELAASHARFDLSLAPKQEATLHLSVACELGSAKTIRNSFEEARAQAHAEIERAIAWSCHVRASSGPFNTLLHRAESDLLMMTTKLPTGPYPYAGLPWFNTPFGRDGIITALECLWLRPDLARGVLAYLAATQATEVIPAQDAEPGKIVHETRRGEMAKMKEMPFGQYYGSVDATPLFVLLAGAYYDRTGDRTFVESIWPNIEAALRWIECDGDRDGDGFVEYQRHSSDGLLHQGWKDSDDAIFHADGSSAMGPIALCEVQGYVYAALRAAATIASELGHSERSLQLARQAAALKEMFEHTFWCEELSSYALALDGNKRPCRVRTSNPGHCLYTEIASPEHARCLAHTLFAPESYSGWGIRTLATCENRYNPMGYHVGCVWPHDNALIAQGLARYGHTEKSLRILTGLFDAALKFELNRLPELFCGFPRVPDEGPVPYPLACSPQAWSAASVFMLVQACLGLTINGVEGEICFTRPELPVGLGELRIHNLKVAESTVDLLLVRHEHNVSVNVLRREGDVRIVVEQ